MKIMKEAKIILQAHIEATKLPCGALCLYLLCLRPCPHKGSKLPTHRHSCKLHIRGQITGSYSSRSVPDLSSVLRGFSVCVADLCFCEPGKPEMIFSLVFVMRYSCHVFCVQSLVAFFHFKLYFCAFFQGFITLS